MKLAVTEEGMPSIQVDGVSYPLFMSVMGFQRWAEFRGVDFEGALQQTWTVIDLGIEGLRKLLQIMLESGEARRVAVLGGTKREIGEELIERAFALYHPLELGVLLSDVWNMEGDAEPVNPPTINSTND